MTRPFRTRASRGIGQRVGDQAADGKAGLAGRAGPQLEKAQFLGRGLTLKGHENRHHGSRPGEAAHQLHRLHVFILPNLFGTGAFVIPAFVEAEYKRIL